MAKRKWADLAAWYFSDDKNEIERKVDAAWIQCKNPSFIDDNKYRRRERKFNEGEWYQVTLGCNGEPFVMVYFNDRFRRTPWGIAFQPSDLSFIGESLGKLNFGGKDE